MVPAEFRWRSNDGNLAGVETGRRAAVHAHAIGQIALHDIDRAAIVDHGRPAIGVSPTLAPDAGKGRSTGRSRWTSVMGFVERWRDHAPAGASAACSASTRYSLMRSGVVLGGTDQFR